MFVNPDSGVCLLMTPRSNWTLAKADEYSMTMSFLTSTRWSLTSATGVVKLTPPV